MRLFVRPAVVTALGVFAFASSVPAVVTYTDQYTLSRPAGFTEARPAGDQVNVGGQVVGAGYGSATGNQNHALLWNGTSTLIDLNPSGFTFSRANGAGGGQQVGDGYGSATGQVHHALLWNGTNAVIDLHPATGYQQSAAFGAGGGYQVGEAVATGANYHAMLWHGTNAAVDLHPVSGFTLSSARGVGDGQQVGYGYGSATGGNNHALLWHGTKAVIDLHPVSGFSASTAYAVAGGQQVGAGTIGGTFHALLWNGTNAAVDLHPDSSFVRSAALGVGGGRQVGYGFRSDFIPHALIWDDTAASVIDLHAVLPATFRYSYAYSISGNTVYGVAQDTSDNYHAIAWTVPEPTSAALLACGAGLLLCRRARSALA